MEYKIKDVCNELGFGVCKFYKLKEILINSIPEQNRTEYFYNNGRNFYITDKGFEWFKENNKNNNNFRQNSTKELNSYTNEIIDLYKKRIEYLENENKRLLDIITLKEQKELAKDVKKLGTAETNSIFSKIINKFKLKS